MEITPHYLPLDRFHIVAIRELDPRSISTSAREVLEDKSLKDREPIKHTTLRNSIIQALGFSNPNLYKKHIFPNELQPFMEKNNLQNKVDFFEKHSHLDINIQMLSDRIFKSKKPLPFKAFTGWDLSFETDGVLKKFGPGRFKMYRQFEQYDLTDELGMPVAHQRFFEFSPFANYIGDTFFQYGEKNSVNEELCIQYYNYADEYQKKYEERAKYFSDFVKSLDIGWVELLPFNNQLVFLKGPDGTYDFIFPNMRIKKFSNPYAPYLKHADLPGQMNETYDFQRWLYYGHRGKEEGAKKPKDLYTGWEEKDRHYAENFFYSEGGTVDKYPGLDKILKNYLQQQGIYRYRSKKGKDDPRFTQVELSGKTLCISDLVTIKDFHSFIETDVARGVKIGS